MRSSRDRRVIAITGASAGIGRATALRLAREGCAIAGCARRADRLEALAREITAAGGQALTLAADVTSEPAMTSFVERTVERFGRLDVMMCNAGFGIYGAIDDISADQMRKLMDVNYFGTFYAARAALAAFRRQRRGHLVDRRQAGRAIYGGVLGDEVRPDRHGGVPEIRSGGIGHSRKRRLPDLDGDRIRGGHDPR